MDTMNDLPDDGDNNGVPYRPHTEIKPGLLAEAVSNLQLLRTDSFLRMQTFNLDVVDQFLADLEYQVLRELYEDDRTPQSTHFLNAQSQMWIFAAYELLRTWTERNKDIIKWAKNGGLEPMVARLEAEQEDFLHFGRDSRIEQLKAVIAEPELLAVIDRHLKHLHIPFKCLAYIRMSLAKHEVAGKRRSIALHPGYGRINIWCGSLDYATENGRMHLGTISRRDIADELRALRLDDEPPPSEQLEGFDEFMKATPLPGMQ